MGGQFPIAGATVKVYATTTNDYGVYGGGTLLQEANQKGSSGQDTDASGTFQFAGGYTCPAGQLVYLVSSGGNTGANAINPNAVLVAALGRCEDLYANTAGGAYDGPFIYVNELTTVAAAYALGKFSTVSGTGAFTVVGIGAPAENNAPMINGVSTGCIGNFTDATCKSSVYAAGLAHAFQNAYNLVNPFANTSVTGANANLPGNSAAVVPRELINSLGNILVACVNSAGGSATATGSVTTSDGTPCGDIFAATSVGTIAPTDTFRVMLNLAANPTLGGNATSVANFFNVSTAQTNVYHPSLTSSAGLHDFSIGISYPAGMGATNTIATTSCKIPPCQGLIYPVSGALDINDVYYVGNQSAADGTVPINLFAFSSNGTLLSTTTNGAQGTLKFALGLSVDDSGHGYFGSGPSDAAIGVFSTGGGRDMMGNSTSGGGMLSQYTITHVSAANGAQTYRTAVDFSDHVWTFGPSAAGSTLYESPIGGAAFMGVAAPPVSVVNGQVGLAIDSGQNIWTAGGTTYSIVENTEFSGGIPTYSASAVLSATTAGSPVLGITFVSYGPNANYPYVAFISSSSGTSGIQPYYPRLNRSVTFNQVTPGPLTDVNSTIAGTFFSEADGDGNIWLADNSSHSVIQYNPSSGTAFRYLPCVGGSATCSNVFTTGRPFEIEIDSTGSIWVPAPEGGQIVQLIGAAAPTWPLLLYGTFEGNFRP